jgi:nucleotide-binding universal stress UspA family protein
MRCIRLCAKQTEIGVTDARPYVILAAIAFDDTGAYALQEATRHARLQPGAELHLVHVVVGSLLGESSELLSLHAKLNGLPEELQRRVDLMGIERPMKMTAHLRAGAASDCILQTAVDLDADLIVVGTRKRRGVGKLMFGSVAERVLHSACCPVLVAVAKDHRHASESLGLEPACADCLALRERSTHQGYWCERHARSRMVMHLHEPPSSREPTNVR